MKLEKNPKTRGLFQKLLALEDRLKGMAFPGMKRVKQITVYHCGPAVIEALYSYLGVKISQRGISRSIRVQKKIKMYGLNVDDLAKAAKVAGRGKYTFWRKNNATLSDLARVVNKFKYPVGVEWQGVFYEHEDEDSGHYSIVTKVDKANGILRISDPYPVFSGTDRKIKIKDFIKRWWDENEVSVAGRKRTKTVVDNKVMFLIAPKSETWPRKLGMVKK